MMFLPVGTVQHSPAGSNKGGKNTATYRGYNRQLVTKDGRTFSPKASQQVFNHSPNGFSWGYAGSGPAQLALALLLDVTKDPEKAAILHQEFKVAFVSGWGEQWEITTEQIEYWVRRKGKVCDSLNIDGMLAKYELKGV